MIRKPENITVYIKPHCNLFIKIYDGVQFNFINEPPSASTMCFVNGFRVFDCAMTRNSPALYDYSFFDNLIKRYNLKRLQNLK